jgi:poly-gamma-glutamate capsule biosynthesis protein CapA/YwtB (metallophosphatase superfamily)
VTILARPLPVVLLAAVLGLTACSASAGRERSVVSPVAPSPPVALSPSATPSPPAGAAAEITLAFAGDVHFTGRTSALLNRPATAFGPIAPVLAAADLTMVNLETAVTQRGTEQPKEFHFRAPPAAFDALGAAGIDVVSLANNHVLDYGQVGLADTLDSARRSGFPVVGIGHNATEAYAARIMTARGVRVAILAFSQVHTLAESWAAQDDRPGVAMAFDLARATAVAAARQQADVVVVYNHWGQERNQCPTAEQKAFAARLAAAGADVVLGTHAHVLLGDGWLDNTYVQYGLGNFLWYTGNSTAAMETGVLRLTLRGRTVVRSEFLPAVVTGTGQPRLLTGAAADSLSRRFAVLRRCTGLAGEPSP